MGSFRIALKSSSGFMTLEFDLNKLSVGDTIKGRKRH